MTSSGDWTLTVPGGTVTVRVPQSAWPTPPTPRDYILVLRVDAGPAGDGFASGMPVVEVTARWAIAGTYVNQFNSPIEIVFSGAAGTPAIPAYSTNGSTWQTIAPVDLPCRPRGRTASAVGRRHPRLDASPHLLRPDARQRRTERAA